MVKFYPSIPPDLQTWALLQPVFFTSTAPLTGSHINLSPKGLPSSTFAIFSPTSAAYIDATGSGCETISHVYENGRITIMFCSFAASPRILRFFCRGRVVEWDDGEFEVLLGKMGKKRIDGARAVIVLDIWKVQTSCGYGVPRILSKLSANVEREPECAFEDRDTLGHWAKVKTEKNELRAYQMEMNGKSLDGLPGLRAAREDLGHRPWVDDVKVRAHAVWAQKEALGVGVLVGLLIAFVMGLGQVFLAGA